MAGGLARGGGSRRPGPGQPAQRNHFKAFSQEDRKFLELDWFDQKIVRALLHRFHGERNVRLSGDHDDGSRGICGANVIDELDPFAIGKVLVDDDRVEIPGREHLPRGGKRRDCRDRVVQPGQELGEQGEDRRFIIDEVPLLALVIVIGVAPGFILRRTEPAVRHALSEDDRARR